jgi:hypothetical protein
MARTYFAKNVTSLVYPNPVKYKNGRWVNPSTGWKADPVKFLELRSDAVGGEIHPQPYSDGRIHITFRNNEDYTMFVLKYGAKYS